MSDLIAQQGQRMQFTSEPWVILSPIEQSIKAKIERYGTPLKNWDIQINYGIKTGCNEAFIIDETKRAELIAKAPKSAEIIRPILRGKDIKRYGYDFKNLYLIASHNGYGSVPRVNMDEYPAIKDWLDNGGIAYNGKVYEGYEVLAKRADQGDTPYNLRSCVYMDEFSKPKIVYSETNNCNQTKLFFDNDSYMLDKTCFLIVSENTEIIRHVYDIMSSEVFTWYMKNTSPLLANAGISMTKDTVEIFPLCAIGQDYHLTEEEKIHITTELTNCN